MKKWTTILECHSCEKNFTHVQEQKAHIRRTKYRKCPHCGAEEDSEVHFPAVQFETGLAYVTEEKECPAWMKNAKYVRADHRPSVDAAILHMMRHRCPAADILTFQDPKIRTFGWMCACGMDWVFQLFPFKLGGVASKYREEMRTHEGREMLKTVYQGCIVPRCEEEVYVPKSEQKTAVIV